MYTNTEMKMYFKENWKICVNAISVVNEKKYTYIYPISIWVVKIVRNNCFKQPTKIYDKIYYPNACGHKIARFKEF